MPFAGATSLICPQESENTCRQRRNVIVESRDQKRKGRSTRIVALTQFPRPFSSLCCLGLSNIYVTAPRRSDDPVVRVNLGNILAADGGLDAATVEYLKALALRPGLAEAKLAPAKTLARGQRFREAGRLYREVVERRRSQPGSSA
jgi:Flp pilus assembly protein TadD